MSASRGAAGACGFDLVEVARFRKSLEERPRLEERLFTPAEIAYCRSRGRPHLHFAARFAAKEAIGKLLGTGVIDWQEVEISSDPPGQVTLRGATASRAASLGIEDIGVSLSHVDSLAGACLAVVARPAEGATVDHPIGLSGEGDIDGPVGHQAQAGLVSVHPLSERPAVFTPAQVRELDRATIEDIGVPGPVLMERAALGVSALVQARYPDRHTLIVCGKGNNGGDGLAAARQLHLAGHPVACVVAVSSERGLSPDAALNYRAAHKAGVNLRTGSVPDYLWDETELVVDCLLGTGARGEFRDDLGDWARRINAAGARGIPVLAVDVPSGVDASTGGIAAGAVAAEVTITFHCAKTGLVCPPGAEAAGEVVVWDIGIPAWLEPEPDLRVVTRGSVSVPGRRVDDHKYSAGYLAVVAGSRAYPGAAWLTARAACETGAGYVRLLAAAGAAEALRSRLVEAVIQVVCPGESLGDAAVTLEALSDPRLHALVIGPGVGRHPDTMAAVRRIVLENGLPAVLDADGLVAFAGEPEALQARSGLVLTPHMGELAALLGVPTTDLAGSPLEAARRAAATTRQVVLLKGSSTIIVAPGGETRVVVQGPPQSASAGTGDVLSGVIGTMLAKGLDPFEAACTGAWLHAEAGRVAAGRSPQGILAGDLVQLLPAVVAGRTYSRRPSWMS